jgi:hypothetical protein
MNTTPVAHSTNSEVKTVDIPEGYSRVWSGRIEIGDLYLHWLKFWQQSIVEWVRMSVQRIIENGPYYETAEWFGCVIRERADEKGYPCIVCHVASPIHDLDLCSNCVHYLYPAESDQESDPI